MRRFLAVAIAALAAGCATTRDADIPKAPEVVTKVVERYRPLPDWALRLLPEDAPRQNTVDEAKRLASDRLSTIQAENCRKRLLARLDRGEAVNPKACDR